MKKTLRVIAIMFVFASMVLSFSGAAAFDQICLTSLDGLFEGVRRISTVVGDKILYGYADADGATIIPCQFDHALPFKGGVAAVQNESGWGFIDKTGQFIVQPIYSLIDVTNDQSHYFEWVPYTASSIHYFEDGPRRVRVDIQGNILMGLIDSDGTELLKPVYDNIERISCNRLMVQKGNRIFLTDLYGKPGGPQGHEQVFPAGDSGLLVVGSLGDLRLATPSGELLEGPGFEDFVYDTGEAFIVMKGGKYGFLARDGKLLVDFIYDYIAIEYYGLFSVQIGERWGITNGSGQLIVPVEYNWGIFAYQDGSFWINRDERYAMANIEGEFLTDFVYTDIYDSVQLSKEPAWKVTDEDGVVRLLNADGNEIVSSIYEDTAGPNDGVVAVKQNGKWFFTDGNGQLQPLDYDHVQSVGEGLFLVTKNDAQGYIDAKGNVVIPLEYKSFSFENGVAVLYHKTLKKYGCIAADGTVVVPFDNDYDYIYSMGPNGYTTAKIGEETVDVFLSGTAPSAWAEEELALAASRWLIPYELQYRYRDSITRAEFCRLAVNYLLMEGGVAQHRNQVTAQFTDTSDPDILLLAHLGIVNGVGDGRFDPDGLITREQAAVLLTNLMRFLGLDDPDEDNQYNDHEQISLWASDAVRFVSAYGIINGVGDNIFLPKGHYTREQSFITISRIYNAKQRP